MTALTKARYWQEIKRLMTEDDDIQASFMLTEFSQHWPKILEYSDHPFAIRGRFSHVELIALFAGKCPTSDMELFMADICYYAILSDVNAMEIAETQKRHRKMFGKGGRR